MKFYPFQISLIGLIFLAGCGPAVEDPKTFDNNTIKFSYPGNWQLTDSGSTIGVQEQHLFGLVDGETYINLSIGALASVPPKHEHVREVQTKILNKTVTGELTFDWLEGDFETSYFVEKGDNSLRVLVSGQETTLKNAEPGVRQILESIELF